MRFSVIIPVFNKAPYVSKSIRSVLAQSFTDYELIIMDDGSNDNSYEIAARLIEGYSFCHIFRQQNEGVSAARNKAVALSTGDYICFLDADDWWSPSFLGEMSNLIDCFPDAGIFGTNYIIYNETKHNTRIAPLVFDPSFEKGYIDYCDVYAKSLAMPLTSISVAIPRAIFDEMHGFQKGIKLGEDFLLWLQIALKYRVAFLNKPLSYYNQDVDIVNRGVKSVGYDPDSFMTFHFDQFESFEKENHSIKILLDRIRVYSLLRFRFTNSYKDRVKREIDKVDFKNVNLKYRFLYKLPFPLIWGYNQLRIIASSFKLRER